MYFSSDFQRSNCWYFFDNIDVFWHACVFASVYFWCFFGKVEGEKRSEANPRTSKQWKSSCEMNISGFLCFSKVVRLLKKYEHRWFPKSIWLQPGNEISDFHEIPASVWFMLEIWSGRFGCSHVMVSVIFKVAQGARGPSQERGPCSRSNTPWDRVPANFHTYDYSAWPRSGDRTFETLGKPGNEELCLDLLAS